MHDFSQRPELSLHAEVAADITGALIAMSIAGIVVGAFARDLHLHYGAGVPVQRGTEDIDVAFLVRSWEEFTALRERLVTAGSFQAVDTRQHRLRHRNGIAVDLVPFGMIETAERTIAWPPSGDTVMDVFGFREALASAGSAVLPGEVTIQVVSLAALGLLKIVAWHDRHRRSPGKDATDLSLIIRNYLAVPSNQQRLWNDFIEWTQSPDFDYEQSGARMLGHDMRHLVQQAGLNKIEQILRTQIDEGEIGELPQEMDRRSPERAHALLQSLYGGFSSEG